MRRPALATCVLAVLGASIGEPGARMAVAAADAPPGSPAPARYGSLIPQPAAATERRGAFAVTADTTIVARGGARALEIATSLRESIQAGTGLRPRVARARGAVPVGSIVVAIEPTLRSAGTEGYRLRIAPAAVVLSARTSAGLFYGLQTIRQLAPPERGVPWRLRAGAVDDHPRFAWRGLMLDVARHFFGPREVERYVDLMALHKLNRLHLHLTDDQGWRLAIRSWPRLARVGGRSEVGGGPGGYYTQRQYADLVAYAAARHVVVVPEIDMPGHVNAALSAYGRLACDGVAPEPYSGIDVGFSSLCADREITYRFVDDVVREVAALTPGPYVHIGGDEALSTTPGDYVGFLRRARDIVRAHGKRTVAWEEGARAGLGRGSLIQHWHDASLARRAVAQGARVIMSPAGKAYLDAKYDPTTRLGLSWAGTTSVRDAYAWDPRTVVAGLRERDIAGVEAPLWTETAATSDDLDYLAFPRLLGLAEIAWSPRGDRDWRRYRRRLAAHGPRLRALGIAFHRARSIPWR